MLMKTKNEFGLALASKPIDELWGMISPSYMIDEVALLDKLLPLATPSSEEKIEIDEQAISLVHAIRGDKKAIQMIDALLLEYS